MLLPELLHVQSIPTWKCLAYNPLPCKTRKWLFPSTVYAPLIAPWLKCRAKKPHNKCFKSSLIVMLKKRHTISLEKVSNGSLDAPCSLKNTRTENAAPGRPLPCPWDSAQKWINLIVRKLSRNQLSIRWLGERNVLRTWVRWVWLWLRIGIIRRHRGGVKELLVGYDFSWIETTWAATKTKGKDGDSRNLIYEIEVECDWRKDERQQRLFKNPEP